MGHIFKIYLIWSVTIGSIFIFLVLVITMTPLGRLFPRSRRRHKLDR